MQQVACPEDSPALTLPLKGLRDAYFQNYESYQHAQSHYYIKDSQIYVFIGVTLVLKMASECLVY